MRTLRVIHALVGLTLATACDRARDPEEVRSPATTASAPTTAYDRALASFAAGALYKPDDAFATDPAFDLAPLIVHEVRPGAMDVAPRDRFGAVRADERGSVHVDTDRPTVYAGASRTIINGTIHQQAVYLWRYPRAPDGASVTWRWIRITRDAGGFPAISEVHDDAGETRHLFVSRSLEAAAANAFGPPLPGRRFSVERNIDEQPNVIVTRVLEDGPQPMGPFVYVAAADRSVTTLLCRCMPSQVDDIVRSTDYDLRPLASLEELPHPLTDSATGTPATRPTTAPSPEPPQLEEALRLPPRF